jgi:hypothetical protein
MPLDRSFPTQNRFRIRFTDHSPVYIYIDNLGGWNIDTQFITSDLRRWMEDSFQELFDRHFPILTVQDILEAKDEVHALFLLHVTLTKDTTHPEIVVTYYDQQRRYAIPGMIRGGQPLRRDDILDDFSGGTPSLA